MKINQDVINRLAVREYERAIAEMSEHEYNVKKFRSCTAEVITTKSYYILRSYNTLVACVNRYTGIESDVLRKVYGYTATSAQHIHKFFNDYKVSFSYPAKRYQYR